MQVALFGGDRFVRAARCSVDITDTGGEGFKDRVEMLDGFGLAADHQAVAPFQAKHATAGAHVHVMDPPWLQSSAPGDVILVVRVPTIDDDVTGLQSIRKGFDGLVHDRCGYHDPCGPRLGQLGNEFVQVFGADGPVFLHRCDRLGIHIENHALVPGAQQPPDHVGAHAPQADHP